MKRALKVGIEAVKAEVAIEDYAEGHLELKRQGTTFVALCPFHEERTPSFTIYPGFENGHYKCFGCGVWGDVIDLEKHFGNHAETWTAMIELAMRYHVELPKRPPEWFERQETKHEIFEGVVDQRARAMSRRLFRVLVKPSIDEIEDPYEHDAELKRSLWEWSKNHKVMKAIIRLTEKRLRKLDQEQLERLVA
jgi:hypothetical protein